MDIYHINDVRLAVFKKYIIIKSFSYLEVTNIRCAKDAY